MGLCFRYLEALRSRVYGLWVYGFWVWGLGFLSLMGLGFGVLGFRVWGLGFWGIKALGFRVVRVFGFGEFRSLARGAARAVLFRAQCLAHHQGRTTADSDPPSGPRRARSPGQGWEYAQFLNLEP